MADELTRDEKIDRILAMLEKLLPVVDRLLQHPMLKRWIN